MPLIPPRPSSISGLGRPASTPGPLTRPPSRPASAPTTVGPGDLPRRNLLDGSSTLPRRGSSAGGSAGASLLGTAVITGAVGAVTLATGTAAHAQPVAMPAVPDAALAAPSMAEVAGGSVIEPGMSGPAVSDLQRRLGNVGYPLEATGSYGPETKAAVERFQGDYGVQVTGRFGPTTLSVLEDAEGVAKDLGRSGQTYVNGKAAGTLPLFSIDGKPIAKDTANVMRRVILAARRDGVDIQVVSGFRTQGEQRALYRAYKNGTGNLAAPAGYSEHQSGRALDLNTEAPGVLSWLKKNGAKYDLHRTVSGEDWHWEYRP